MTLKEMMTNIKSTYKTVDEWKKEEIYMIENYCEEDKIFYLNEVDSIKSFYDIEKYLKKYVIK